MIRIAVLGSMRGASMQAIVDAIDRGEINASIELVISNKPQAYILERAQQHSIESIYIHSKNISRDEFDRHVMELLNEKKIDLVLLIGYMRFISSEFVNKWRGKVINVHPSLLPKFAGGMDTNVHEAVIKARETESGCTIHYVDEGADTGEIILQKKCRVDPNETAESLKKKVQKLEGEAFIEVISEITELNSVILSHMNQKNTQIRRALISVSDKTGVAIFANELHTLGVEIISTGGTAKTISEAGVPVKDISEFTGFPEIMEGRVKTLHPLVHGGILGLRDKHAEVAREHKIHSIDLVVVNLYPFSETIRKEDVSFDEIIENIDIGGPTMIRSAAKNMGWVSVLVDPTDYGSFLEELKNGGINFETRKRLAIKAFGHTAQYDTIIHNYLKEEKFSENFSLTYKKIQDLRYGENPHQEAAVYIEPNYSDNSVLTAKKLQGKELSYNNLNDADGALACLKEFNEPACVVVKHANPCGVAVGADINDVFKRAYHADAMSAFGGIIALNRPCTKDIAEEIVSVFAEIVMAPRFEQEALTILGKKKKNMRVLEITDNREDIIDNRGLEIRQVEGGLLMQDKDKKVIAKEDLQFVTEKKPTDQELNDILFGWKVLKHVKSNGILTAKNGATLGIGQGQVSRVDAVEIAVKKSRENIKGAVLCSDAFFPFRDSVDLIAKTGVTAIIQPGGSIKDHEVIKACNEHGIAMVFTGVRCFKH